MKKAEDVLSRIAEIQALLFAGVSHDQHLATLHCSCIGADQG